MNNFQIVLILFNTVLNAFIAKFMTKTQNCVKNNLILKFIAKIIEWIKIEIQCKTETKFVFESNKWWKKYWFYVELTYIFL